jgi:hypothetical protein
MSVLVPFFVTLIRTDTQAPDVTYFPSGGNVLQMYLLYSVFVEV